MLRRLLLDTTPHAERRLDEMKAAQELLELGLPAHTTTATIANLERLIGQGMPDISLE